MPRYGKKAQDKVERAMHEMKKGKLRSGRSGQKVTNPRQAIAIGLSEAREAGGKVPKKAAKKAATKRAAPKKAARKSATGQRSSPRATGSRATKKPATRRTATKSPRKKSATPSSRKTSRARS